MFSQRGLVLLMLLTPLLAGCRPADVEDQLPIAVHVTTVTPAFLPLLLVEGKVGEFIWSLPVVVTASLVSSRIVSMTFMPLLGYYALKGQKGFEAGLTEGGRGATFARYYNGFSLWCLEHKTISLGVCLLVLGACLASLPLIGTAFFPRDRHSVFTVNVYLSEGAPIRQTAAEAQRVIARIDELEGRHIRAYTTFVGAGGPRLWLSIVPEQRADNYAQILVHTTDGEVTREVVHRLKRSLPPQCLARVTIEQLETGPPVGVPVQIRLYGESLEQLRALAGQTKDLLREIPGTDNLHDDWDPEVLQISMERRLREAQATWPPNYRYEFGGERYEQQKGFASLSRALLISLAAIYLVLVWQFNSVTKPLVVFAAVPFGLAAGMMGLLIFHVSFGFMAFLGIASLAGVIVSHIIVPVLYVLFVENLKIIRWEQPDKLVPEIAPAGVALLPTSRPVPEIEGAPGAA